MIRLQQNGSNQNIATIRTLRGDYKYYFSYETIVAFREPGSTLIVSKNVWSRTTGKHLSALCAASPAMILDHETWCALLNASFYALPHALVSS